MMKVPGLILVAALLQACSERLTNQIGIIKKVETIEGDLSLVDFNRNELTVNLGSLKTKWFWINRKNQLLVENYCAELQILEKLNQPFLMKCKNVDFAYTSISRLDSIPDSLVTGMPLTPIGEENKNLLKAWLSANMKMKNREIAFQNYANVSLLEKQKYECKRDSTLWAQELSDKNLAQQKNVLKEGNKIKVIFRRAYRKASK